MLRLNVFPITFPSDEFKIRRVVYKDEHQLRDLRRQHNETHSFFRRDNYVYISPMENDDVQVGEVVTLNVQKDPEVVSSLIRHIFFRTFNDRFPDIVPQEFHPFSFFSRKEKHDLLSDLVPGHLDLSRRRQVEIQFREYEVDGKFRFGAVVNLNYRWVFDKSCEDLVSEGFDINGRSVLHSEVLPGLKGILAPDESFVGVIESNDGSKAMVESNEGMQQYPLGDLFLKKSWENIREYLTHHLGEEEAERVFTEIRKKDTLRLNGVYYRNQVDAIGASFSELRFENLNGFSFSIEPRPLTTKNTFGIKDPVFIFDFEPGHTHRNKSQGLIDFGPYDSRRFDNKHPRILIVCHRSNRNAFSRFAGLLQNGMPSSSYFKQGMVGKYRLHNLSFDFVELDNYSLSEYETKIREHVRETGASAYDLAFVETKEEFKRFPPKDNPYYWSKAFFLSVLRIPTQFVKNEHLRQQESVLQWTCDSITLQMYAKLRGTPWVLPATSNYDHEIVVGIGSTMLRSNSYSGNIQKRIVGITTFFNGDGRYLLSDRCREVPYESYFEELLSSLRESIRQISKLYGWQTGNVIRIVFHVFKPIKNVEAEVVNRLVSEIKGYDIRFCFVTVSEKHPFLVFDTSNTTGYKGKGRGIPQRGTNWMIDEHSCLLQMRGPRETKSKKHGFTNPVLIRIHENSTYRDLNAIVQQVFDFTHLSWRGFHPTSQPVTISYSNLIAKHLTNLKQIDKWDPDILSSDLKFSKWFL